MLSFLNASFALFQFPECFTCCDMMFIYNVRVNAPCIKQSLVNFWTRNIYDVNIIDPQLDAVKSHFKALGLYNFKRGFGWAYKRGGLYPGGLISGIKKCLGTMR